VLFLYTAAWRMLLASMSQPMYAAWTTFHPPASPSRKRKVPPVVTHRPPARARAHVTVLAADVAAQVSMLKMATRT
jgi:hypothetical protein